MAVIIIRKNAAGEARNSPSWWPFISALGKSGKLDFCNISQTFLELILLNFVQNLIIIRSWIPVFPKQHLSSGVLCTANVLL